MRPSLPGLLASLRAKSCSWNLGLFNVKRTLQNRAFVQILPESFREVLKSLTPKAFGIEQNPWFCKALYSRFSVCLLPDNLDKLDKRYSVWYENDK